VKKTFQLEMPRT